MHNNPRKGLMLILSSPSGAGKTSICKKLLESEKDLVMSFLTQQGLKGKVKKMEKIIFL